MAPPKRLNNREDGDQHSETAAPVNVICGSDWLPSSVKLMVQNRAGLFLCEMKSHLLGNTDIF